MKYHLLLDWVLGTVLDPEIACSAYELRVCDFKAKLALFDNRHTGYCVFVKPGSEHGFLDFGVVHVQGSVHAMRRLTVASGDIARIDLTQDGAQALFKEVLAVMGEAHDLAETCQHTGYGSN